MHIKPSAPANSKEPTVSIIKTTLLLLPQGELRRPEHAPDALQQSDFSPARNEDRTRRASYAERRLSRYL